MLGEHVVHGFSDRHQSQDLKKQQDNDLRFISAKGAPINS